MVLTWALIAAWLPVAPALADSVPTVGNAAGSVTADAGGAPVVISPNITLSNFTTIDGAKVTINGGFVASEDVLAFTSQGGLSGSYNAGNGVLSLSGSASAATYEAVLRSVTYQNTNAATQNTVPRGITFSVGSGALYYQSTGHYYEFVPAPAITWTSARDTAAARSLYGLHGYLATITSNGENTFVAAKVQGLGWIGASDAAQEGVWRWVTGPEAGTQFSGQFKTGWCSAYTGNSVNGQYNHWAGGEPNDCGYNEDYGHYYTDGSWNDYPNYADSIAGYVVEYGGMPGDSAPVLQASTTVLIAPDATGPSVSASLAGPQGQNNWYTGPVLVQMNAADDKSGVASIQYSVDGGPTQTTPGAMAVVPVAADGEHTVTYGATDNAGNPSSTNQPYTVNSLLDSWQDTGIDVSAGATLHITATGSISWDYRRPEAGTTPNGAPSFPYGGFVPNLTFASLVARIGTGQPFMAGANYQGSSATSGRLYLGFNDCAGCFWDNTGSWAVTVVQQQAVSFKVDSTLPTITGSASTTGWSNQPVTVTFTCTDATSGVASCQAPMTVATEGAGQSVTGSAADNAGHSATATVGSINVDLTPPTITGALDHAANAAGWYNGQVSVHFTCADAASGVAACSPDVFLNQEGLGQSATGQAKDNVGLTSTTTVSGIKIDLTPPATTASAPSGWQKTPATVTFSATDNLSGVAGTYASVNGGGAQAANSVTLSTDGVHTLSYYSMDNAGNAEGGATTTQRQMPANAAWYDTGIDVASGSALNISASGLANYGGGNLVNPNGYNWGVNNWLVPNAYALALVGKIGAGPGFNVGASYSSVAATGGRLYLAMNDCVGCFYDNSGFWSVSVTTNNTVTVKVDQTAPTITGSASTTAWTNQPVTVTFTCADATSGVASCQNPKTVSTAGANQAVTGNATDNAGNNASVTVSGINVDLSAPLTTIAAPTTWQNHDVAVTFTATDNLSGVAATYYTVDGGAQQSGTSLTLTGEGTHTVSFWSVDAAGNAEAAHTATVLIDKTAPSISGSTDRAANAAGWYNAAVTVTFTCADSGSGLATCAVPVTLGAAGANQSATGSATDNAGNSANATVSGINIDLSGPATTIAAPTTWQNQDVPVTFTATDSLSGVAATYYTVDGGAQQSGTSFTIAAEGTHTVTFWSVDLAGNTEAAHTATVLIDKTVPTIGGAPDRSANAAGWYNATVTVSFTCGDALSGVATCAGAQTLGEGANQSATGSATDNAGNTASATVSGINVDMTAPTISGSTDRAANAAGWYNADVTVSFTCGDGLSGVANCAGAQTLGEGANQSVTGSVSDKAGNLASSTVSGINVDKSAPIISGSTDRAANAAGWYNAAVTVTFTCGDGLSGVATCAAPVTLSGAGAGQSATGSVTDWADNSASATVSGVNIDLTAPTVTYIGNAGTYTVDQQVNIACTATDDLSGVATSTCVNVVGPAYSFSLGANSYSASATDNAGNVGNGSTSFTVVVTTDSLCNLSRQFAPGKLGNSLCAKLAVIAQSLAKGNTGAARNQIEAFVSEVQAQTGKALTAEQAEILIRLVRSL